MSSRNDFRSALGDAGPSDSVPRGETKRRRFTRSRQSFQVDPQQVSALVVRWCLDKSDENAKNCMLIFKVAY